MKTLRTGFTEKNSVLCCSLAGVPRKRPPSDLAEATEECSASNLPAHKSMNIYDNNDNNRIGAIFEFSLKRDITC